MESACTSHQLLLSAYADGEVDAKQRAQVELHLSGCADCRTRLDDLKALSQALSQRLSEQADALDFSRFADQVMAKVTPERPGPLERLRIAWSEVLAYHRTALVSSLATAAVTLAVAVPLVYRYATGRAVEPEVIVQDLQIDDPRVKPVVMRMDNGKTLIMLVRQPAEGEAPVPDFTPEEPQGGEL